MRIYKYAIENADHDGRFSVAMPEGAQVLTVQLQAGKPALWAMMDEANTPAIHKFLIVGTGHKLPDDVGDYIGTVQDGAFVWHLFETP